MLNPPDEVGARLSARIEMQDEGVSAVNSSPGGFAVVDRDDWGRLRFCSMRPSIRG